MLGWRSWLISSASLVRLARAARCCWLPLSPGSRMLFSTLTATAVSQNVASHTCRGRGDRRAGGARRAWGGAAGSAGRWGV